MATREPDSIFLSTNVWAKDDPDKAPIASGDLTGWTPQYSQAGGLPVERDTFNNNFYRITSLCYDINKSGALLAWDSVITYDPGAVVRGSDDRIYKAVQISTGINPTTDSGSNWVYFEPSITVNTDNITLSYTPRTNVYNIDLTVSLAALKNNFSGATAPLSPKNGQFWYNLNNSTLYQFNQAVWYNIANIQASTNVIDANRIIGPGDNNRNFIVNNSPTIDLPAPSALSRPFKVTFTARDAGTITVTSAQAFYYQGALSNNITLTNIASGFFVVESAGAADTVDYLVLSTSGGAGGLNKNLDNIAQAGLKVILDLIHPVGSVFISASTNPPPLQSIDGVFWQRISNGHLLCSSSDLLIGRQEAPNAAANFGTMQTGATTLSVDQMAPHSHEMMAIKQSDVNDLRDAFFNNPSNPNQRTIRENIGTWPAYLDFKQILRTGSFQVAAVHGFSEPRPSNSTSHNHSLSVNTFSVATWKRIS